MQALQVLRDRFWSTADQYILPIDFMDRGKHNV